MNGQGGRAAVSERGDSSPLKGYWSNPVCLLGYESSEPQRGSCCSVHRDVFLHLLWLCGTGAEAVWGESDTIVRVRVPHGCNNSANSLQGGVGVGVGVGTGGRKGWKHPPQLLSGDQHLGQPLQLCSLLLHGVPDPVHVCVDT